MNSVHAQQKIILGILVLGVFAILGWKTYTGGEGSILSARAQASVVDYEEQIREIDVATRRFKAVQLDVAFLSSPEFRSLKDYGVIIPRPDSIGRVNPFEPLPEVDESEEGLLPDRDESTLESPGEGETLPDFDISIFDNLEL